MGIEEVTSDKYMNEGRVIWNANDAELEDRLNKSGLESAFNQAYDNHYAELTYSGSTLTGVDIWEDDKKSTKLFTKTITYSGVYVSEVLTTDELLSLNLVKTITYAGANVASVTINLY